MNMFENHTTTKFDCQKVHDADHAENYEICLKQDAVENTVAKASAKKEEFELEPKQIFQQIESQYEAYAFASMIMAGLPFPPLPVVVNCGEDMEDGMASSFDLTQQAIMADQANMYKT